MEVRELRVGNLVYTYGTPPAIEVIRLTKDKILIDASPIPLDESWLAKLGFKKPEYAIYWHSPHKDAQCSHTGLWDKHVFDMESMEYIVNSNPYDDESVKVECVHQLQNLYFALTGEELTINVDGE